MKNVDSAIFQNINALNTNCRLILSGTPIQNNMRELLGLISFAMPKMFNNKSGRKKTELFVSYFERKYNNGKAKSSDIEKLINKVKKTVSEKAGVDLELEIKIIGD